MEEGRFEVRSSSSSASAKAVERMRLRNKGKEKRARSKPLRDVSRSVAKMGRQLENTSVVTKTGWSRAGFSVHLSRASKRSSQHLEASDPSFFFARSRD